MARAASNEEEPEQPPRFFEAPWLYNGPDAVESVDADARRRPAPDFFDRLRERRWLIARLVLEVLAIAAGAMLLVGIPVQAPLLGSAAIALGVIAILIDLIVLWRLHRLVSNAWTDLSRPPES